MEGVRLSDARSVATRDVDFSGVSESIAFSQEVTIKARKNNTEHGTIDQEGITDQFSLKN